MAFLNTARRRTGLVFALVLLAALSQVCTQGTVRFDPKTYKGKTGKITVPYRGESALFEMKEAKSGTTLLHFATKDGTFIVPAGSHRLAMYYAYARSGRGTYWSAASTPGYRPVNVEAGKTLALNIGPPCTATVKVNQRDHKSVSMDLKIVGRGGENMRIQDPDRAGKAPGFQVLSPQGKVLMKGSFRYG